MGIYCYTLRSDSIIASENTPNGAALVDVYHYKFAFKDLCFGFCGQEDSKFIKYCSIKQTKGENADKKHLKIHSPMNRDEFFFVMSDKIKSGDTVYLASSLRGWFMEEGGKEVGVLQKRGKHWWIDPIKGV